MKLRKFNTVFSIIFIACSSQSCSADEKKEFYRFVNAIPLPNNCQRNNYPIESFSSFIRARILKNDKTILAHSGERIQQKIYNVFGVIDSPLLYKSDLEQCSDFCMRFWADYHRSQNKLSKLYLFDYNGNKIFFRNSGKNYNDFLKHTFESANSYSLKKGAKKISEDELQPGDMLVQNQTGGIGHVSMIMDVCKKENGEKLYLIGFSFMPAQEFHIEYAKEDLGVNGWFTLEGYKKYLFYNLNYGDPVFRRFEDQN